MPGFTDVFGGQTLQPANVGYSAVALTADLALVWPPYATSDDTVAAGIMEVTPSSAGFTITMPDATLAAPGQTIIWRNVGVDSFTVADDDGGVIAVISAGAARLMWMTDNADAAGDWASILLGVGSSSPDASQLVGYGMRALANTLNLAPVVTTFSASQAVTAADRGKVFVWTGGSGTLTMCALATASTLSDWEIEVRNQGTGTLTIATTGGEQIDASASLVLNTTESCFVHGGPTAWYTVGRGRNTSFNFTKLSKSVTGGSTTLSLTEAANVIQVYSGALLSNEIVTLPAVVQVYYITNSTSGAYTMTFKSPVVGGATVVVTQGTSAVVYCDGTNIINCNTSGVTVNAVSLAVGSAGAPSLSFAGDATTGVYQPSSGQFAITISGTQRVLVTATGINGTAVGATTPSTGAFTTVTATTVNKLTLTAPATGSTLTIIDGKVLTASNTVTLAGTDGSTITFGTGGTVAYTANTLAVFAATTSAQLRGIISDETGTGALVFADTPTLITPTLGVATATSINKVAITAPAASATLTIANTKTLTISNTLTLAGTDGSTITYGAGGTVVYTGAITTSGLTQATGKMLGRSTAATGAVEEITVGSGLALSGGTLSSTLTLGTPVATTSGTSVDLTGIPSTAKVVMVTFSGVSTNNLNAIVMQLGTSGGVEATGYLGSILNSTGAAAWATSGITVGSPTTAAATWEGCITLTLANSSSNTWAVSGCTARSDTGAGISTAGRKALTGTLDRIRLTQSGGTAFDAGEFNVVYF